MNAFIIYVTCKECQAVGDILYAQPRIDGGFVCLSCIKAWRKKDSANAGFGSSFERPQFIVTKQEADRIKAGKKPPETAKPRGPQLDAANGTYRAFDPSDLRE